MRKEYDFSEAKPVRDFPELARLQEELKGKTRITIMLDKVVVEAFRHLAEQQGGGYQTLINQALRESLERRRLDEEALRRVLREEIGRYVIRDGEEESD